MNILEEPMEEDKVSDEAAGKEKPAEQKIRFVNKCVKGSCTKCAEGSCGVIKKMLAVMEQKALTEEKPDCSV